jgi:hypothetical protein
MAEEKKSLAKVIEMVTFYGEGDDLETLFLTGSMRVKGTIRKMSGTKELAKAELDGIVGFNHVPLRELLETHASYGIKVAIAKARDLENFTDVIAGINADGIDYDDIGDTCGGGTGGSRKLEDLNPTQLRKRIEKLQAIMAKKMA